MRSTLDDIRDRDARYRKRYPRQIETTPANGSQAAHDRADLLELVEALKTRLTSAERSAEMACEEPCGSCAGCLLAADRLGARS